MESNTFCCEEIYFMFQFEYMGFLLLDNHVDWAEFVEMKDLGVACMPDTNNFYKVTDSKKWVYTKLKYGI